MYQIAVMITFLWTLQTQKQTVLDINQDRETAVSLMILIDIFQPD